MAETRHIPEGLLDAARDCVLAVGVSRTTLTDVARRAGVSRMTVYRYADDMPTLLLAVVTREFNELLARSERLASRRRTARSRLAGAAALMVCELAEQPLFKRVLELDPEIFLPYLTERLGSTQLLAVAKVKAGIEAGLRDRSVGRCDSQSRAEVLVVALTALALSRRLHGPRLGRDVEELVDRWLAPVARRGGR